ncbi:MAG: FolC bifunctional protein [Candidatus Magasanikbacteria bacterium GW2011_GWC2_37_14]|uniref:tetrahydrofolate synthase n=1 Tax=Candidatus Magasanikbacteria bacterium GW2011_GWC2_37_14 TaxID=1619046 RepID=A0A0G0GB31_9BACT|nr:MAG: FolC bifunctional protein [Candidatus Magasanikbacteria bacterium GW2011_GWC2_37_14]
MNYSQAKKFILLWSKLGRKEYLKDATECGVYLERLQYFLDLIDNPERQIPHYIHVTGTSGKGSVCLMLDSILRANKFKTGTMTSPEVGPTMTRWQINGKTINEQEFAKIITKLKPKLTTYLKNSPYDPISHFELMTAVGLYWFAQKRVKWCILEVGCGGRYDSTNVIPYKDVAVITNIGLDHTEILGKTKTKIAYEKAGIIKRNCKMFTTEKNKNILNIIKAECKKRQVSLEISNNQFPISNQFSNYQIFKYQNNNYKLNALGNHQIKNAILAINIAKSLKIPYSKIKTGLEKTKLPLRVEIISKKPLIILDGAHNPDKMKTTVETVNKLNFINLNLVIGFSEDKNIKKIIKQLITLKLNTIAITKFASQFKKPAKLALIKKMLKDSKINCQIRTFNKSIEAYKWSLKKTKKNDLLLVTGSLYLAGEIRQKLTIH